MFRFFITSACCSPRSCNRSYLSNSALSLMTGTFASSSDSFRFLNSLQFAVHIDWILFSFSQEARPYGSVSVCLCQLFFIDTSEPFSFLACLSSAFHCFLLTNWMCGVPLAFVVFTIRAVQRYASALKKKKWSPVAQDSPFQDRRPPHPPIPSKYDEFISGSCYTAFQKCSPLFLVVSF